MPGLLFFNSFAGPALWGMVHHGFRLRFSLFTGQAIHMPGDSHATRNRAHAEDLDLDLDGRTWTFRNIGPDLKDLT